ncbi:MAG: hypothetical protein O7E57_14405 [Gammaproteobacteria bacterium]|nr:hypothetical protein [Gammaproteobacteria bacterium]
MTFSPVLIAVSIAVVIACLVGGWIGRGIGAKRREKDLNRLIVDAKSAVPQLETAARTGEVKVARLQEESKGLANSAIELARDLENRDRELRSAKRKVRNLASELAAVKGGGTGVIGGLEVEGFITNEDEERAEADSPLAAKLQKIEALYEKLKNALIERDEKIQTLEGNLEQKTTPAAADAEQSESDDSKAFQEQIRSQKEKIEDLKRRLVDIAQEKDMLADMAKRRSQNNLSLKEAAVEAEKRIPELEVDIQTKDKTISDREGSIKRLLDELEVIKDERAKLRKEVAELGEQVEGSSQELTSRDVRITGLSGDIRDREDRIGALVTEVDGLQRSSRDQQTKLKKHDETIAEQQSLLAASSVQLEEQMKSTETTQGSLRNRDFKIETLMKDVADLKASLDKAENQASVAMDMFEKRKAMFADANKASQATNDATNRKAAALGAKISQSDRWMAEMKQTLHDRDVQIKKLEATTADIQSQNDTLVIELNEQTQARRTAEAGVRANGREASTQETKTQQAVTQLKERDQTIAVFKSTVIELEYKVSSLTEEIVSLTEQLETRGQAGHLPSQDDGNPTHTAL